MAELLQNTQFQLFLRQTPDAVIEQDKSFQLTRFATEIDFSASSPRPKKQLEIEMSSDSIVTEETKVSLNLLRNRFDGRSRGRKIFSLIYLFRKIFENSTIVSR